MEIASILINTATDTLILIYVLILFTNLFERLKGSLPNISALKRRLHLSFGIMLLTGFSVVIGAREWHSWFICIIIFMLNLVEYNRIK